MHDLKPFLYFMAPISYISQSFFENSGKFLKAVAVYW